MKNLLVAFVALFNANLLAADADLTLPGERWLAKNVGYRCQAYGDLSAAPLSHQSMNVQFETLTSDYTLDNALIKATFEEDGVTCRYSVLLFADNTNSTIEFVKSNAFSPESSSVSCARGKAILDANFEFADYLYWGHPHHATIMMPVNNAEAICGPGATTVGIDFVVSAFIGER